MVTSSAVVGSSAMSRSGIAGDRHGDHDPLPHPAGELVGVVVDADLGPGDADQRHHLQRLVAGRRLVQVVVDPDDLGDLLADGVHRVERRHRVLEDHRDLAAPDLAQLLFRRQQQIVALPQDLPALDAARGLGDEPQDAHGGDGFARPGLAHHGEDLTRLHHEADAVDRPHGAAVGFEIGPEVADLQQRVVHQRSRGSSASRKPSPMKTKAMTVKKMAAPGKNNMLGDVCR